MARIANPAASAYPGYASPYPTDPSWAAAGQSLGTALFGDPEAAAKLALQKGQAQYYDAESEQARAGGALSNARQALVDQQTTARGRLTDPGLGLSALTQALLQGSGENADLANTLNEARGGDVLYRAADPAGAAATAAAGGLGGTIASISAPSEDQMRAAGALMGHTPSTTTAYTVGQGDHAAAADVAGKIAVAAAEPRIVADGSHLLVPGLPGSAPAAGAPGAPMWGAAGGAPAINRAILAQESGGNPNIRTSVDGAHGVGQVMPATFAQFARPGERIDSPADNAAVANRIIDTYSKQYGGDPARVAVAYFSGPGNVAPPGSPTPYINDRHDGNGVHVSQYVNQVLSRARGGGAAPAGAPAVGGAVPAGGGYTDVFYNPKPATGSNVAIPDLPANAPSGIDYLKTLPAARQARIQAFIDGRAAPPNINSRANDTPENQALIRDIMQVDPTFDAVNFQARAKVRQAYTSGPQFKSIVQLNQALGHLSGLAGDADNLGNYGGIATLANPVANLIATNTGDPRVTNFQTQRDAVVSELNNLLRGGVGAEGDITRWTKNLNANASPDQLHGAISHIAGLIGSRLSTLEDGYSQGMGTTSTPLHIVNPAMAQAMTYLTNLQKRYGDGSGPQRVASAAPAHASPAAARHVADADLASEFGH